MSKKRNRKKEKNIEISREELLMNITKILKSVNGVSVKGLKAFLESKGIYVSEKEISECQDKLLQEKREKEVDGR